MIKPDLYTIIVEVEGGTYISQIFENYLNSALVKWADSLNKEVIVAFNALDKSAIVTEIIDRLNTKGNVSAIDGLINVWFFYIMVNNISGYINIIKTEVL